MNSKDLNTLSPEEVDAVSGGADVPPPLSPLAPTAAVAEPTPTPIPGPFPGM